MEPTGCEVCGSCCASAAMILCQASNTGCQAGCHSFCLPQHGVRRMPGTFICLACSSQGGRAKRAPAPAAGRATRQGRQQQAHPSVAAVDWAQLPSEVLALVLQHVGQQDRLRNCSLVSRAWAAAAAAATNSISIARESPRGLQRAWAACAAGINLSGLTRLKLVRVPRYEWGSDYNFDPATLLYLPCARLRALEVCNSAVQLTAAPASAKAGPSLPGLLDAATGLTQLHLQAATLCGDADQQLPALLALTGLQDLTLGLQVPSHAAGPVLLSDSLMEQLGAQLTALTQLRLSVYGKRLWSASGMHHLSSLTRLRSLSCCMQSRLGWVTNSTGPLLFPEVATFLQCLTALSSLELSGDSPPSALLLPCLGPLSALQHLVLRRFASWDPAVLARLTGLRRLEATQQLIDGGNSLMAVVQQQTQLEHLQLDLSAQAHGDAVAHGALTASTALQSLELHNSRLPYGAWQHMFPPWRKLQALTSVHVSDMHLAAGVDLRVLVQACPALQQLRLQLPASTWGDGQFLALSKLTCLTQLAASRCSDVDLRHLLQLTRLLELRLPLGSMTFEGLQGLTALQQLTKLYVALPYTAHQVHRMHFGNATLTHDGKGSDPVWVQVQRHWQRAQAVVHEQNFGVLDRMGIPIEGYPAGHHGRSLRSSRAKQQGKGAAD